MHPITVYEESRLRREELLRLRNPYLRALRQPTSERLGRWLLARAGQLLARAARDHAVEVPLSRAGVVAQVCPAQVRRA